MQIDEICKPTLVEEQVFLNALIESIAQHNRYISMLEDLYSSMHIKLISPCYFNFRDALFHYEKAYTAQEIIQLYCEQNALQEHLHRALKDGCVYFLQRLNKQLVILYSYSCPEERWEKLCSKVKAIADNMCISLEELQAAGQDIINMKNCLPDKKVVIGRDEARIIAEYLFNKRNGNSVKTRKLLQQIIHRLRNYELDMREGSMHIGKPFSVEVDPTSGKPSIERFFDICKQAFADIDKLQLRDFVIAASVLHDLSPLER